MHRLANLAMVLVFALMAAGCPGTQPRQIEKSSNHLMAAGTQMDITMEGPWILKIAKVTNQGGQQVSVLVAIAPIDATVTSMAPGETQYHHLPQFTSGDGFYVRKKFLPTAHVFCMTFDGNCAPQRGDAPTPDGHPPIALLTVTPTSGQWNWVDASQKQAAFILPMPESWSNDGVWYERFVKESKTDGTKSNDDRLVSIGLHLHYLTGPTNVGLMGCTIDRNAPATSACNIKLDEQGKFHAPSLTNTGTVRLEMKAPDLDDACDPHVRNAWSSVYSVLGASFDTEFQSISPALGFDANEQPQYDDSGDCDQVDLRRTHGNNLNPRSFHSEESETYVDRIEASRQIIDDFFKLDTDFQLDVDLKPLWDLKSQIDTLNPDFPRISQLALIAHLSRTSPPGLKKFASLHPKFATALRVVQTALSKLDTPPGTKNGGDCRAPLVLVSP